MNNIYLMRDQKMNYNLYKVGFTKNLEKRVYAYTTANPEACCISFAFTQDRSKRKVEKLFHDEITERGYEFMTATIDGKKTEWFRVYRDDPFCKELDEKGLNAFNTGKNRKTYGELIINKKVR